VGVRLLLIFLTFPSIVLSWATANASPDTVRAVTVASVTGFGNIGSIVGVSLLQALLEVVLELLWLI